MKYAVHKTCIRTLKSTDPKFRIKDGLVLVPRAAFEINSQCPEQWRRVILSAIDMGWLQPVANVKDEELFWEAFQE